ncbi:hypothetical protein BKK56_05640 [Rodentibacter genomosp. 2]|uniref:hypothetical protein n=1 Tax=Rodentibacter genomosp. 2 TaxID=1908266 RepID=UPI00098768BF|nr:hypothetical protein BKK56_05640 [Rodentibacter genomosp. 2]
MKKYWWVNQSTKKGYAQNKIIWAPEKNKQGNKVPHWDSLFDANIGDEVIHYTDGYIVGISQVIGKAKKASNPYPDNLQWGINGKRLPIEYYEINSIHKEAIHLNIRKDDKSVFDKNGHVKQGYFFLIDDMLKQEIKKLLENNHKAL